MVLQNFMDLLKVETGVCSETCPTSSHVGSEVISVKVEEVTDTQEEEDPLLIRLPDINSEHEVSCMFISILGHIPYHVLPVVLMHSLLCMSPALKPGYALVQHMIIRHQDMARSGSCCLAVEAGAVEVLFYQQV
jgi:hypothetical protein